jgi:hypothetical protein
MCDHNVVTNREALIGRTNAGRRAGDCAAMRLAALLVGADRDDAALAGLVEIDHARAGGEDRVVATEAGAVARAEAGAPLAHDDLASANLLAGEDLDPQVLGVRVAPVAA